MKDEFFDLGEVEKKTEDNPPQDNSPQITPTHNSSIQIVNGRMVRVVFIRQLLPNAARARRSKISVGNNDNDIVINQVIDKVQWKAIMSIRNHSLAWLHRNAVNTPWGWIYFSGDPENDVKEEKAVLERLYTRIVKEMGREARPDVVKAIRSSLPYMEVFMTIDQAKKIFTDILAMEVSKVEQITEKLKSGSLTSKQHIKLLKKKEELETIIAKIQDLMKGF